MIDFIKNLFSSHLSEKEKYIYAYIGKIALWLFPILVVLLSTAQIWFHSSTLRLLILFCGGAFLVLFLLSLFFSLKYKE